MWALNIIIFVLVYGRMIEIYLLTSLSPIPVATLANRELGHTGQNYLRSLFAVGFQGMLILVCVAIYAVLVQGIATGGDPIGGDMGHRWLYGIALLYAVQNGQYLPAHFRRALEGRRVWQNIQPWDKMSRSPRLPRRGCSLWTASRACAPCPTLG